MSTEISVRWVIFEGDEKIGEGTTVATPTVLNLMIERYAKDGQRFMWARLQGRPRIFSRPDYVPGTAWR